MQSPPLLQVKGFIIRRTATFNAQTPTSSTRRLTPMRCCVLLWQPCFTNTCPSSPAPLSTSNPRASPQAQSSGNTGSSTSAITSTAGVGNQLQNAAAMLHQLQQKVDQLLKLNESPTSASARGPQRFPKELTVCCAHTHTCTTLHKLAGSVSTG